MQALLISKGVDARDVRIGEGFQAKHLSEEAFHGLIDPIIMLDHFRMSAPTFQPHPHAGISAVTYVFEDSRSAHFNHDSLGNNGPIRPGSLHWLMAGKGAVHTEQPQGPAPEVHALQIFVNLPASQKHDPPRVLHIDSHDVPEHRAEGVRMRVVLGEAQGLKSPASDQLPQPFTLLDGFLAGEAATDLVLPRRWGALLYVVQGSLTIRHAHQEVQVSAGQGLGLQTPEQSVQGDAVLRIQSHDQATHFAWLAGRSLHEPMVKHGPFAMNTAEQVRQAIEDHQAGRMGQLEPPGGDSRA